MIKFIYSLLSFLRRRLQRRLHFATLGVKALVINDKQEVLLVEHTYTDGWHLPGGGVHPGETPYEAMCRELKEETGLIVLESAPLFAIYTHEINGATDYPVLYIVNSFEIIPKIAPCAEIKQMGWFGLGSLPENTKPHTRQRVKEALQGLVPSPYWG